MLNKLILKIVHIFVADNMISKKVFYPNQIKIDKKSYIQKY